MREGIGCFVILALLSVVVVAIHAVVTAIVGAIAHLVGFLLWTIAVVGGGLVAGGTVVAGPAAAVELVLGLLLRRFMSRHPFNARGQTIISTAAALMVGAASFGVAIHHSSLFPSELEVTSPDELPDRPTLAQRWQHGFRAGGAAADGHGQLLSYPIAIATLIGAVGFIALRNYRAAEKEEAENPRSHSPTASHAAQIVSEAVYTLGGIDQEIGPLAAALRLSWPPAEAEFLHAIGSDPINQHTEHTLKVMRDRAVDQAQTDLHHMRRAHDAWMSAKPALRSVKREIEDTGTPEELRDFEKELALIIAGIGMVMRDRDWSKLDEVVAELPGVAASMMPYEDDADELGFSRLADVTRESLKRHYRRRAAETHPDRNKSPDASKQFDRAQRARDRLTKYLDRKEQHEISGQAASGAP